MSITFKEWLQTDPPAAMEWFWEWVNKPSPEYIPEPGCAETGNCEVCCLCDYGNEETYLPAPIKKLSKSEEKTYKQLLEIDPVCAEEWKKGLV